MTSHREQRLQRDGRGAISGSARATTWQPVSAHRSSRDWPPAWPPSRCPWPCRAPRPTGGRRASPLSLISPDRDDPLRRRPLNTSGLTCTTVGTSRRSVPHCTPGGYILLASSCSALDLSGSERERLHHRLYVRRKRLHRHPDPGRRRGLWAHRRTEARRPFPARPAPPLGSQRGHVGARVRPGRPIDHRSHPAGRQLHLVPVRAAEPPCRAMRRITASSTRVRRRFRRDDGALDGDRIEPLHDLWQHAADHHASYAGFVNADSDRPSRPSPPVPPRRPAPARSWGSPYTSSCSGAVDPNYTITYVGGRPR